MTTESEPLRLDQVIHPCFPELTQVVSEGV